jgi:hypothetical protein
MNLKNISRDSYWIDDVSSVKAWSTSGLGYTNSDGVVHDEVASIKSNGPSTALNMVGIFMNYNDSDNCPYRVKAYVPVTDNLYLFVGYGPASITGTNDLIPEYRQFHLIGEMDEIFMMPKLESSDTYYQRPVFFGIHTDTGSQVHVNLSVQKLDVSPPQFAMAVP